MWVWYPHRIRKFIWIYFTWLGLQNLISSFFRNGWRVKNIENTHLKNYNSTFIEMYMLLFLVWQNGRSYMHHHWFIRKTCSFPCYCNAPMSLQVLYMAILLWSNFNPKLLLESSSFSTRLMICRKEYIEINEESTEISMSKKCQINLITFSKASLKDCMFVFKEPCAKKNSYIGTKISWR